MNLRDLGYFCRPNFSKARRTGWPAGPASVSIAAIRSRTRRSRSNGGRNAARIRAKSWSSSAPAGSPARSAMESWWWKRAASSRVRLKWASARAMPLGLPQLRLQLRRAAAAARQRPQAARLPPALPAPPARPFRPERQSVAGGDSLAPFPGPGQPPRRGVQFRIWQLPGCRVLLQCTTTVALDPFCRLP